MTKEYPEIVIGLSDEKQKELENLYECKCLIRYIESYDNTCVRHRFLVENMDKSLRELSNGNVCTRIWRVGDVLHCVVIYNNDLIKDKLMRL